ncbi:hypothetical protein RCC89_03930 [Cytophagaceae bacterium ABcell3]|nr:hypothetical protein RCC89_03930 [Cytophagaceae bacterium ABcell3]
MRIVDEIPHLEFKITIYSWNGKYILKLEKGMYEQVYKISEMDVVGDEDAKKVIEDEEFMNSVMARFKEMNASLNNALNKL